MDIGIPLKEADITKEWLQQMLEKYGDPVTVTDFTIEKISGKGDNFTSQMFTVAISSNGEVVHDVVVKIIPEYEWQQEMVAGMYLFEKEICMYTEVIPAMIQCQTQDGPKILPPVPKCYYGKFEGKFGVLVMENVATRGYEMIDVIVGLSLDETLKIMESLAVLHALGYNLKTKLGDNFSETYPSIMKVPFDQTMTQQFLESSLERSGEILRSYKQDETADKLMTYTGKVIQSWMDLHSSSDPFSTIGHGDAWSSNIMFQYKGEKASKKVENAMLLDLQLNYYGTGICDLGAIIGSSAQLTVMDQLEKVLAAYHQKLMSTLEALGLEVQVSLDDVVTSYKKHYFIGFLRNAMMSTMFGFVDKAEIVKVMENIKNTEIAVEDFDAVTSGDQFKVDSIRDRFLRVCEDCVKFGVFPAQQ